MAQIPPKPKPRTRTTNCFLGCFGFSRKVPKKMRAKDPPPDSRGKIRWFARPRLRIKKYVDTKTVPVDSSAVPEKPRRSPKRRAPATAKIPAAVPDQALNNGRALEATSETGGEIILAVGEISNDVGSLDSNTCRKRLFIGRKSLDKKTSGGHPNSPENRPKATRSISTLSHSLSFSPPKRKKKAPEPPRESERLAGKLSPAVGMSMITVTLIIILLWGKLCAIICSSAFFYFIPRLRTNPSSDTPNKNKSNRINEDLIYEENKKKVKVVFEGFLERDHRRKLRNV
ncbi:uncharacterized protein At5g23160-like [Diospyros lotus]|uniref:uncharacterized protein At5g23160-like n=1 Tax=Diospyros lotus TaxID=55363 RepID=UPI002257A3E2|nr:uncharacterized protein At5g23160-like [Diospyros lotus]